MADITYSSTTSFLIGYDWNDDATSGEWMSVRRNGDNTDIIQWEVGVMRLVLGTGFARLNGPIEFRNTSTGNIVEFYQNGTRVALVDSVGKLWANGVVTLSAAGAPAAAGLLGEVRVETGAGKIWFNVDGSTTWKYVTVT